MGRFDGKGKDKIQKSIDKLNAQIFHLGKSRTVKSAHMFNTTRARTVLDWIEGNFHSFLDVLPPVYKEQWDPDGAIPAKQLTVMVSSKPDASAAPPQMVSTTTISETISFSAKGLKR